MRTIVLAVGRLQPPYADDVQHYQKLLARHTKLELAEVREEQSVEGRIPDDAYVCLLSSDGREFDSMEFSRFIDERRLEARDVCFVIGGPRGLSLEECDLKLSLGPIAGAKLERPPRTDFGDFSSNAPMLLAPVMRDQPRAVPERLGERVSEALGPALDRAEVAGPGFLNLFLADAWFRDALGAAAEAGDANGRLPATGVRHLVEFVSANPTGPITVASGRHAAWGGSLCRILEAAGHQVQREYYVNDQGSQVLRFGESIRARARGEEPPEDGYRGEYVAKLAERLDGPGGADPAELAEAGVELMVEETRAD